MRTMLRMLILAACIVTVMGCTTTTSFKLPPNTQVRLDDRDDKFKNGDAEMRPFFWNSLDGVNYSLVKEGKTVRKGKLPAEFRIVSIFWPPYAFIYWPMGLKYSCYDLTDGDEVRHCN